MKKTIFLLLASVLLWSSCETHTGAGAFTGATFGAILGSAIGGIAGGPRGHDLGTVIGMTSGAAIGASVGAAADEREAREREEYRRAREQRYGYGSRDQHYDYGSRDQATHGYGSQGQSSYGYDHAGGNGSPSVSESGFDATNSHDDRITFDAGSPNDSYSASRPTTYDPTPSKVGGDYRVRLNALIEIRNARFIDLDRDGCIRPGEQCKVTFEIMNNSSETIYDVQPTVIDVTANKHLSISPNLHVESIAPHSGVRYTASILAGKKLKDGQAVIRLAVAQGNREITSQVKEFVIPTRKH